MQEACALDAAYVDLGEEVFRASPLTRGPWYAEHQHAGPPSALICRAIERAAANDGLTHLGRLTVNLYSGPRPSASAASRSQRNMWVATPATIRVA